VENEDLFDKEANEANIKLSKKMNDNSHIPHGLGEGGVSTVTEANLKIQEAFYDGNNQDEILPTYVTNETAAIKITGNDK
jgi:hypothetical protein